MPTIYSEGYSAIWEMWDENGEFERIRPHLTPLECGIIFDGIPEGAISRKVGLIWGIPANTAVGETSLPPVRLRLGVFAQRLILPIQAPYCLRWLMNSRGVRSDRPCTRCRSEEPGVVRVERKPTPPQALPPGFAPNVILRPPEAAEESGGVWSTDTSTPLQTLRFAQGDRRWAISSARLFPRKVGVRACTASVPSTQHRGELAEVVTDCGRVLAAKRGAD